MFIVDIKTVESIVVIRQIVLGVNVLLIIVGELALAGHIPEPESAVERSRKQVVTREGIETNLKNLN